MNKPIFNCQNLSKTYYDGQAAVAVLKGVNLTVEAGERIAIIGPSGSGKSTLLHLLGGLDKPSQGQLLIEGQDWANLAEKKRCQLRNRTLGFVYQFHHLLPEFSALENVCLPLLLAGFTRDKAKEAALAILTQVGLSHRLSHRPAQLSGGERQRVAIARGLVHKPSCLLADEPTGNLDKTTALKVFELLLALNEGFATALVIVTHDQQLAARMDRVLKIEDGYLIEV